MTLPPPSTFGLPFDTWRPGQARTIHRLGASTQKILAVQAPTGTGKSAIALGLAETNGHANLILTATKALQDQYGGVTPDLTYDVRGMANYECLAARDEFADLFAGRRIVGCDEGPCHVGRACQRKPSGCLYFDRVRDAAKQSTVVTSYAYWLSARRFAPPGTLPLGPRTLLICDEAHNAPDEIMSAWTIQLSAWQLNTRLPEQVTRAAEWRAWAKGMLPDAKHRAEVGPVRERLRWKRLYEDLTMVSQLPDTGWAWESDDGRARLAPFDVRQFAPMLIREAEKVVFLSATLTPGHLTRLGLTAQWIVLPSPFPLARRPVYVLKFAPRIDYRLSSEDQVRWLGLIDQILDARRDRRGIIHTVSYERARLIAEHSRHQASMIVPTRSAELPAALAQFRETPDAILLSPAITQGLDLPYDLCEYQILAKVPFPDVRSPVEQARLAAEPMLRNLAAMETMVQATGRAMRAADDQCETFITDAHAVWFLRKYYKTFSPQWWWQSVKLVSELPAPLPKLTRTH